MPLANEPGDKRLRHSCRHRWNDGDKQYEHREFSRKAFLDFWHEPADSPVWSRDGVYKSYSERTANGHVVKYVLLDTRYNKDPYGTKNGDFLGENQWAWLEGELKDPEPDVLLLVSSIQVSSRVVALALHCCLIVCLSSLNVSLLLVCRRCFVGAGPWGR